MTGQVVAANRAALERVEEPLYALDAGDGSVLLRHAPEPGRSVLGFAPALPPSKLGDPSFLSAHGVTQPYVSGALAGGIGSVEMVVAMGRAGMLGGFGAGGLSLDAVDRAIGAVQAALPGRGNYKFNLLHNPRHPHQEMAVAELYLARGLKRISASGYMSLTLPLVLYRAAGLSERGDGSIHAEHHVLAKLSRPEVARELMEPAPEALLSKLVALGKLSARQASLARRVPVAEDITVEGDSGGHTDNQALFPLLASIASLRDRIVKERGYQRPIRVGAAGGIATPGTVAAAFVAGAAYVLTGSINQACVEAGTSSLVKRTLCEVDAGGFEMAPAADMFELGVRVQVMKHKTLFAARSRKLFELYKSCGAWEEVPERDRKHIEERYFKLPFDAVWREAHAHLESTDPARVAAVERDPKQKLAMCFKWYLHQTARWAIQGTPDRSVDFQVWCGPAMAAFNQWVKGTWLEAPEARRVVPIAHSLLLGASALLRARLLAFQGVVLAPDNLSFEPLDCSGVQGVF